MSNATYAILRATDLHGSFAGIRALIVVEPRPEKAKAFTKLQALNLGNTTAGLFDKVVFLDLDAFLFSRQADSIFDECRAPHEVHDITVCILVLTLCSAPRPWRGRTCALA